MSIHLVRVLVLTATLVLAACSDTGPSDGDLAAAALDAEDLPGRWSVMETSETALVGGFCDLGETVDATGPSGQAVSAMVSGELLLRHTLLGYAEGAAEDAEQAVLDRFAACADDEEIRELGVAVVPVADPEGQAHRVRLELDVADLPLALDVAVWRDGNVLSILRLSFSRDGPGRTSERLDVATDVAREQLAAGRDR